MSQIYMQECSLLLPYHTTYVTKGDPNLSCSTSPEIQRKIEIGARTLHLCKPPKADHIVGREKVSIQR